MYTGLVPNCDYCILSCRTLRLLYLLTIRFIWKESRFMHDFALPLTYLDASHSLRGQAFAKQRDNWLLCRNCAFCARNGVACAEESHRPSSPCSERCRSSSMLQLCADSSMLVWLLLNNIPQRPIIAGLRWGFDRNRRNRMLGTHCVASSMMCGEDLILCTKYADQGYGKLIFRCRADGSQPRLLNQQSLP